MPQAGGRAGRPLFTVGEWETGRAGEADEATAAVVAHQLLTSLAVIAGTSASLRDKWAAFTEAERASMLNRMEACAVEAAQYLRAVATGRAELLT